VNRTPVAPNHAGGAIGFAILAFRNVAHFSTHAAAIRQRNEDFPCPEFSGHSMRSRRPFLAAVGDRWRLLRATHDMTGVFVIVDNHAANYPRTGVAIGRLHG